MHSITINKNYIKYNLFLICRSEIESDWNIKTRYATLGIEKNLEDVSEELDEQKWLHYDIKKLKKNSIEKKVNFD